MATEVDSASQAIVKELERQGILNNTLVIFTSDNWFFYSEHGISDKWYPHQESIRVSEDMIGTTNENFTLSIDLAPTMVSAAGIAVPARMQGRDMSALYRRESIEEVVCSPWRTDFYYELPEVGRSIDNIPPNEALVLKDFKLVNWTNQMQEQLFDLNKDPWELKDVIDDTQYQEVLDVMRKRLSELQLAAK